MTTYDWATAGRHYRTAILLRPHCGNPHNQCGVISNYDGDDLSGFYHYSRSILCHEPYQPQGRANLEMLLRKNRDMMLVDPASNSQQRRRILRDPKLRGIVLGNWFVRPLGLINLLSHMEHVVEAQEDALAKLPSFLDSDSAPSDVCLKLVCCCIFTVTDLERQVREPDKPGEQDEICNRAAPDAATLRNAYQHALGFTLRVAALMLRSAKASHHHLQACGVLCLWLYQHPHLIMPQKDMDSVYYDCERLRRAQESFAESLVDTLNLNRGRIQASGREGENSAACDVLGGGKILPEDVLLAGWTPLRGCLEPLWQSGNPDGLELVLVSVRAVEDKSQLLKARLNRAMCLASMLSQPPGYALCFIDPSTGELSVEGPCGAARRARLMAVQSAGASGARCGGQELPHAAAVDAAAPDLQEGHVGSSSCIGVAAETALQRRCEEVCGECGAEGQAGRVDEFDKTFYCDACWDALDAMEADSHLQEAAACSAQDGAHASANGCMQGTGHAGIGDVEKHARGADEWQDSEEALVTEEDEVAFGSASLVVAGDGGGLDDLAQQAALFGEAMRPMYVANSGFVGHTQAAAQLSRTGVEDAGYGYLEEVVQRGVEDGEDMDSDRRGGKENVNGNDGMEGQKDEDEDEEEIVFQPRSNPVQASRLFGAEESCGYPAHGLQQRGLMPSCAGGNGAAALETHMVVPPSSTTHSIGAMLPAQSSLWGGFGTGPCGFGSADSGANANWSVPGARGIGNGSAGAFCTHAPQSCDAVAATTTATAAAARFSTRNPFAQ